MGVTIQLRGDTAAAWAAINPVLHLHELGVEQDTNKAKFGDGVTAWNSLAYWSPGGFGGAEPANTVLAGPPSGAAAVPTFRSLVAGDIPQLSNYAPTGLVGAGAPTAYAGGTVIGHPLYGSWTQGQWVVDLTGQMYVCVTSGTPGGWRRVKADPWQFFVADYARCDGQQALVSVTTSSASISTTPLAAPSAPSLAQSAGGGLTLLAVYQALVTYVNRWGETVGSTSASITLTGTNATITLNTPAASGNATGYNVYMTGPGGATFWKQNATPITLGVSYTQSTATLTSGTSPPGADSSAAQIFSVVTTPSMPASGTAVTSTYNLFVPVTISGGTITQVLINGAQAGTGAGTYLLPPLATIAIVYSSLPSWSWASPDVGKNCMINGGLGSPGTPYLGTIATVVSPTAATVGDTTMAATQAGCAMVFSTDDRLAVDQCVSDAKAYALVHNHFVQVVGPDKIIGLGSGVFQSVYNGVGGGTPGNLTYNTQVRVPVDNSSGQTEKMEVQFLGPGDNTHAIFWVSALPNLNGCCYVSYSLGPNTVDPVYGQQSVIGAPHGGAGAGANGFYNVNAVFQGVQVVVPGWSNSYAFDVEWASGFRMRGMGMSYAPSTNTGGGINPSNAWVTNSFWQAKLGAALRAPTEQNNDNCYIESFTGEGTTQCLLTGADHLVVNRLCSLNNYFGIRIDGVDMNAHDLTISQWSIENCGGGIFQSNAGGHVAIDIVMDGENTGPSYDIQDNGNNVYGRFSWNDPFRSAGGPANILAPIVVGAANLKVWNRQLVRQVYGAPTYTLGTALQNPWWDTVTINLLGGTVTNVQIGPTSAACTTSIATSTASLVSFKLPAGWWFNITGSVKPTTFQVVPD